MGVSGIVLIALVFGLISLLKSNGNSDEVALNNKEEIIIESNSKLNIYKEETPVEAKAKSFKISFLGELMMGGDIGEKLGYNYKSAFKEISENTKSADYTVVNMGTNIIDLKKITNSKSEYIVTKNILSAFNALGVDAVNIANDHIMDFDRSVLKDTKSYINEEYDLIGLKNTIIYAEHDGIKVAIIGVCNEVIGNESKFTNNGIMMYNLKTLKNMIKEAKKNVNTVVMLTHLGLENTYEITDIMAWFYRQLISYGADIVLGDHAMGIYPVEIYKGKPIIYSMGYLMNDTTYKEENETGIFSIYLNKDGYIEKLEIIPLYIVDSKKTVLYSDYSKEGSKKLIKTLVEELNKKVYTVSDNKITVNIK